jgi:hypothetical protein
MRNLQPGGYGRGDNSYINAFDAEDVVRQIDARKRLAVIGGPTIGTMHLGACCPAAVTADCC